jgi:hypothetical protein
MNETISSLISSTVIFNDDSEGRQHQQQQQQQQKLDVRLQKADGTYRWISWMIKVIIPTARYDESISSTPSVLLSLTGRDVTDQREQHVRLLEKKRRLQDSHRIARLGQWDLDLVTNKLEWSEWIYLLFQMDPKEFGASYEAFLNAIHPDGKLLSFSFFLLFGILFLDLCIMFSFMIIH